MGPMMLRGVAVGLLCGSCTLAMGQTGTAKACGVAPVVARDSQPNIFTEQQEGWLGDVEADKGEPSFAAPMRDRSLSEHLQGIVDRLVGVLPPTSLKFRVTLIDGDEVNGWSLAGGHIYMTRKLAAAAENDDELAGVLGHEIGHIVSHQFAFEATAEMKRLLQVTTLGDEADVRSRFGAMLDAEYKDKHPQLHETAREQEEADRIGVYAVSAAGYRPQAASEFWNRVFFVQGKTGNRFGDLFGFTKPDQKRLRGMLAMAAAIPAGCGQGMAPDRGGFQAWHRAVVANQAGAETVRSAALKEVSLTPPLRMELSRLKFSPDGKSILAQDDSSVFVLQRAPLALRYRIDAESAMPANFSPDSQSVTFSTPGLRTEQWSVAGKNLIVAHELLYKDTCYDSRLSPDGRTLLCIDMGTGGLGVSMLDTGTSSVLWEKKSWFNPTWGLYYALLWSNSVGWREPVLPDETTPDGNTLLLGGGETKIAWSWKDRAPVALEHGLKDKVTGDYAFLGSDKLIGIDGNHAGETNVFSFPDGRPLDKLKKMPLRMSGLTNPGTTKHVLIFGQENFAIGIGDLTSGKVEIALKTHALDEFDGNLVAESGGGGLNVWPLAETDPAKKRENHVELPLSPLSDLRAVALSEDGRYLALSTRYRGAVWDVTTGKGVFLVEGFSDAAWTSDGKLYLDVPKKFGVERHMTEIVPAPLASKKLPYKVTDEAHMRYGRLTDWKPEEKSKGWMLEMHEPATDAVVWSKRFPDKYFDYTESLGSRDLIFNFKLDTHTAKDAMKANPALVAEAAAVKDKKTARLIQVVDGKTGADAGELIVELPGNYAGVDGLNRAGDLLYVQGVDHRTSVYSISSGKPQRELVGYVRALDPATGRVCTTNRLGEALVFDAAGTELAHYQLGDPIRYVSFREGAKLVTMLTSDQKVRTMNVDQVTAR